MIGPIFLAALVGPGLAAGAVTTSAPSPAFRLMILNPPGAESVIAMGPILFATEAAMRATAPEYYNWMPGGGSIQFQRLVNRVWEVML
jgi:hypothetical protein